MGATATGYQMVIRKGCVCVSASFLQQQGGSIGNNVPGPKFAELELVLFMGFPGGTRGEELTCQQRRRKRCRFDPRVGKIPWWRAWLPTPVVLPGEAHGQRSLAGYSPQGHTELDTTEETQHAFTDVFANASPSVKQPCRPWMLRS